MILSNIKQFLFNNKKFFSYIAIFFLISFLFGDTALAAGAKTTDTETVKKFAEIINAILKGVSLLLWLMTYLATVFLSPEWINGSLFWMNAKFKEVWIMVSNVVYFIFAFILIWIAFMNIIWKNAEQYQLKQALPKFIVWVLIVPFSWFLVQFILSVSAILTVSALTLPIDSFPDYQNTLKKINVPAVCTIDLDTLKEKENSWEFIKCPRDKTINLDKVVSWWNSTNSIYWIISMYTYWIIGFDNVDTVNAIDASKMKSLWDILVKVIFDLLFVLIYAILIIALWMVLMIRWIYIWIYTMMSPIFWLMYFFDKKDWGWDWFFGKFTIKELISLAMVPVYTMLALSFGLLFMYVVWSGLGQNTWGWKIANQQVYIKDWKVTIWTTEKFTLEIIWSVSSQADDATSFIKSIWWDGLWIVWGLILKIFGIVVLWGTVIAAMSASKVTEAIIKPLQDFGTKVWGIVTSAPANLPVFGGQSMKSMGKITDNVTWAISQKNLDRASKFTSENMPFIDSWSAKKVTRNWKIENDLRPIDKVNDSFVEQWKAFLKNMWDTQSIASISSSHELLKEFADKASVDIKSYDIGTREWVTSIIKKIESKTENFHGGALEWVSTSDTSTSIDQKIKKISWTTTTPTADNDWFKKWSSWENFADFAMWKKDIRVTINSDWTRQVNVNNWAENLWRLMVEWYTPEKIKTLLADMWINTPEEIKKTFEEIIKGWLYYNKKTKKYYR